MLPTLKKKKRSEAARWGFLSLGCGERWFDRYIA